MPWPLRCSALRVLNSDAQADSRPALQARAPTVKTDAFRKVYGACQYPSTIADNTKALGELFARLAGSRDDSGSTGREGRAFVKRIDDRARIAYAAATPAVRKASGARQHPATIADNAKALGYLFIRLAGSRDSHKVTARTLARLCVSL
jgi:hypothetical protein